MLLKLENISRGASMAHDKTVNFARGFNQINLIASAVELEGLEAVTAQPITGQRRLEILYIQLVILLPMLWV